MWFDRIVCLYLAALPHLTRATNQCLALLRARYLKTMYPQLRCERRGRLVRGRVPLRDGDGSPSVRGQRLGRHAGRHTDDGAQVPQAPVAAAPGEGVNYATRKQGASIARVLACLLACFCPVTLFLRSRVCVGRSLWGLKAGGGCFDADRCLIVWVVCSALVGPGLSVCRCRCRSLFSCDVFAPL